MTTLVTAAHFLLPDTLLADPVLLLENDRVLSISTRAAQALPPAAAHHRYPGATLAPAFFDVHTHGCRGHDVMEATAAAFRTIGSFLAAHGVGAYLPTTVSAPRDATLRSLAGMAQLLHTEPEPGHARPLGIHLEGPFLSHAKRGAHAPADLLPPSIEFFDTMWEAAEGRVVLMTVAPELPGALDLIRHATAKGVHVSIGHSDAPTEQAQQSIAAGAVSATHTFNAMRKLDQRDPGILGVALSTDTLFAEIICDGLHVDPMLVQLFARAKGARKAILITDSMSATGMPDGTYKLGRLDVQVTGGRAVTEDGALAGSTLTMDAAVRNYTRFAGVPLAQALWAATRNPAAMTGLSKHVDMFQPGNRADFNVLSPEGELHATYLGGVRVRP